MKATVLFVDDEPLLLEAMRDALRRHPYEVVTAGSAREGLEILSKRPVDVVVSDERMPGTSGSEFLSQVR
ncbi:MAG: response regulator [Candidatus Eisenbacteria bacterium]